MPIVLVTRDAIPAGNLAGNKAALLFPLLIAGALKANTS
jgi:hypothetical protein